MLAIAVAIAVWAYDLPQWLTAPPRSVHVWRQTDGASYALNYYQNDRPLLQPQVHHRFAKEGSTASEFPIIYYTAAQLYRWFGFHDYYIRWIGGSLLLLALFILPLAITHLPPLWRLLPSLMLLTSPLIVYYGPNYLPDVPAFAMALVGLVAFVRYTARPTARYYWLMLVCMTLAALLKISAAVYFMAILGYLLWQWWRKQQKLPLTLLIGTLTSLGIIISWVVYVDYYNTLGGYTGNLQGFYGIWEADAALRAFIWQRLWSLWRLSVGGVIFWVFTLTSLLLVIRYYRRLPQWLAVVFPLTALAAVFYFLGWFKAFADHDYYLIPLYNLLAVVWLGACYIIATLLPANVLRYSQLAVVVLFVAGIYHTQQRMTYRDTDPAWNAMPAAGYWTVAPYARSIGIARTDLVYVHHVSTNIPLYFLNNPGFTDIYGMNAQKAIEQGADYIILHDTTLLNTPEFAPFKGKQIGAYKGIYFYRP